MLEVTVTSHQLIFEELSMSNRTLPLMKKHIYTIFPLRLCPFAALR
jgi:hypothetical protein